MILPPQKAIEKGFSYIILSDRAFGPSRVPIPSLLATGAVHHHLVGLKMRTRAGLLVETGEVCALWVDGRGGPG
jgi:glutamate synthase (NADPH/NADH) large chain